MSLRLNFVAIAILILLEVSGSKYIKFEVEKQTDLKHINGQFLNTKNESDFEINISKVSIKLNDNQEDSTTNGLYLDLSINESTLISKICFNSDSDRDFILLEFNIDKFSLLLNCYTYIKPRINLENIREELSFIINNATKLSILSTINNLTIDIKLIDNMNKANEITLKLKLNKSNLLYLNSTVSIKDLKNYKITKELSYKLKQQYNESEIHIIEEKIISNKTNKSTIDYGLSYHNFFLIDEKYLSLTKSKDNVYKFFLYLTEDMYMERYDLINNLANQGITPINISMSDFIDQELSSDFTPQYYVYFEIHNTKLSKLTIPFHLRYQKPIYEDYTNVNVIHPILGYSLSDVINNFNEINYDFSIINIPNGNMNDTYWVIVVSTIISVIGFGMILFEIIKGELSY